MEAPAKEAASSQEAEWEARAERVARGPRDGADGAVLPEVVENLPGRRTRSLTVTLRPPVGAVPPLVSSGT